jgi:hypothetical protein
MRDEMEARLWVEHGRDWSDFVARIVSDMKVALKALHRLEFDAPWRSRPRHEL